MDLAQFLENISNHLVRYGYMFLSVFFGGRALFFSPLNPSLPLSLSSLTPLPVTCAQETSRCVLLSVREFSHGDAVLVLPGGRIFTHPAASAGAAQLVVAKECLTHVNPPALMVISMMEGGVVEAVPL